MQLSEAFINKILEDTQLLPICSQGNIYDLVLPFERQGGSTYKVEDLLDCLTESERFDFFKVTVLNWFFGIESFDYRSWGWFTNSADEPYKQLPLFFTDVKSRDKKKYTYFGMSMVPDSLAVIVIDNTYWDAFKLVYEKIQDWYNNNSFKAEGFSLPEWIAGVSAIGNKLREGGEALDLFGLQQVKED